VPPPPRPTALPPAKYPHTGLGAKDTPNALVMGRHPDANMQCPWDTATPAARAVEVQRIVSDYRRAAKEQLRADDRDVAEAVDEGLRARRGRH